MCPLERGIFLQRSVLWPIRDLTAPGDVRNSARGDGQGVGRWGLIYLRELSDGHLARPAARTVPSPILCGFGEGGEEGRGCR